MRLVASERLQIMYAGPQEVFSQLPAQTGTSGVLPVFSVLCMPHTDGSSHAQTGNRRNQRAEKPQRLDGFYSSQASKFEQATSRNNLHQCPIRASPGHMVLHLWCNLMSSLPKHVVGLVLVAGFEAGCSLPGCHEVTERHRDIDCPELGGKPGVQESATERRARRRKSALGRAATNPVSWDSKLWTGTLSVRPLLRHLQGCGVSAVDTCSNLPMRLTRWSVCRVGGGSGGWPTHPGTWDR